MYFFDSCMERGKIGRVIDDDDDDDETKKEGVKLEMITALQKKTM